MQEKRKNCNTEDGYKITVAYDSSTDSKKVYEEICQIMIGLAKEQNLNREEL